MQREQISFCQNEILALVGPNFTLLRWGWKVIVVSKRKSLLSGGVFLKYCSRLFPLYCSQYCISV